MKALKEAILRDGVGIGNDIVKVDSFLNHRIDVALSTQMGQAFYEAFKDERVDCILTVEASGIAVAVATAIALNNIPVVFAKKSPSRNATDDAYQSRVYSYTHSVDNYIRVAKPYLPAGSRVLIVDDFLANGEACDGLCDLVRQAGATVAGIGVCVEKSFQPGHGRLEQAGYKVYPLARVTGIRDGRLLVED